MKLIVPLAITDANLDSTVPMEGMAYAYDAAIDYGVHTVIVASGGFPHDPASVWYRNINASGANLNNTPASSPAYWAVYPNPMWDTAATYDETDLALHWVGPSDYSEAHWWRSRAGGNTGNEPPDDPTTADAWWEYVDIAYQRWCPGESSTDGWLRNYDGYLYDVLTTNSATVAPPDDPVNWFLSGPTNRFKALDNKTQTQTELTQDITYVIAVDGRIDTIGLLEMDNITSVTLTMLDGVTEVHNETYSLLADDVITDWYAYFYASVEYERELIITGLPTVLNPSIIITLTGTGTRKLGHIAAGTSFDIGNTLRDGAQIGIDDFSRITTDEFGNREVVERGYSRRGQYNVMAERVKRNAIYRLLAAQRANPALFIPSDEDTESYIFGYPRNWGIGFEYNDHFNLNLTIEGL